MYFSCLDKCLLTNLQFTFVTFVTFSLFFCWFWLCWIIQLLFHLKSHCLEQHVSLVSLFQCLFRKWNFQIFDFEKLTPLDCQPGFNDIGLGDIFVGHFMRKFNFLTFYICDEILYFSIIFKCQFLFCFPLFLFLCLCLSFSFSFSALNTQPLPHLRWKPRTNKTLSNNFIWQTFINFLLLR